MALKLAAAKGAALDAQNAEDKKKQYDCQSKFPKKALKSDLNRCKFPQFFDL